MAFVRARKNAKSVVFFGGVGLKKKKGEDASESSDDYGCCICNRASSTGTVKLAKGFSDVEVCILGSLRKLLLTIACNRLTEMTAPDVMVTYQENLRS